MGNLYKRAYLRGEDISESDLRSASRRKDISKKDTLFLKSLFIFIHHLKEFLKMFFSCRHEAVLVLGSQTDKIMENAIIFFLFLRL